ncbi:uncharacterized protein LOC108216390 isoform X1 [Daucus carota subsp. sativus]|uniref:uncharacterized protein LOC108216390 isoform X1 n=1 Tax=Daucus carota subsp. sativus TaxID=79200 RepID=UPI0030834BEA
MHIRFKFRSAVSFDEVDIGDRPAISVMELKSKIIARKNLNSCHDFDLVFSDPVTGQEYKDGTHQIPSNSSVIIKRVPAGSVPAAPPDDLIVNLGMKKSNLLCKKSGDIDVFDDFGIDSCVVQDEILPHSNIASVRKNICDNKKENISGLRSGCQKRQAGDFVKAIPKGFDQEYTKGKFPPEKLESRIQEHVKLDKRPVDLYDLAEKNSSLPPELRCSICNKILREAVMIPCCQHSFCERCIRGVLGEKAKCPRCFSHKFTEVDLLPNLSLRQAIEHFLESQNQFSISENALQRFAPDEESGVQAKDLSSDVTIVHKRPKKLGREGDGYAQHACSLSETGNLADFQGENDPVYLPQIHMQERGEGGRVSGTARYRKADRTCYMCNAPDHFIRDCPFANGSHHMPQTGNSVYEVGGMATNVTPYWNNTAFGPLMPYPTMYGNTGLMPFSASLYPVSPIEVYPYMPYMYGHVPAFGGNPRMASVAPLAGNTSANPFTHAERSNSEVEYKSNNSKRYDGERHSHNHYNVTKNRHERRGHYGSDSSCSNHGETDKNMLFSDDKNFIEKYCSQFGPRVEPSSSRDEKRWCRGGDHRRGSSHHRDGVKYIRNE